MEAEDDKQKNDAIFTPFVTNCESIENSNQITIFANREA